jgi:hypothetical protein
MLRLHPTSIKLCEREIEDIFKQVEQHLTASTTIEDSTITSAAVKLDVLLKEIPLASGDHHLSKGFPYRALPNRSILPPFNIYDSTKSGRSQNLEIEQYHSIGRSVGGGNPGIDTAGTSQC